MVSNHFDALKLLWKDSFSVFTREAVTDPENFLTTFREKLVIENQPGKLSFKTLSATADGRAPTVSQSVKLFCEPSLNIPPGSKIVVKRFSSPEREFVFSNSGEPGVFTDHQEINLELFKEYA